MLLQACVPPVLKDLVHKYHTMSTLDGVQYRISRVKHWMARARQMKELDKHLVKSMRPDVASVLHGNRVWEEMLKASGYEDMGVVKEFAEGSHLVGTCDVTGLWPKKFTHDG